MPPPLAPTVGLIIPAFNEEAVITRTLAALPPGLFSQVIVAVNGSSDRTADLAHSAGATVVEIPARGYGAACLAAIPLLSTDIAVFLQADLSEDPALTTQLLAPILSGDADLVIGSRASHLAAPGALLPHQRFGNWLATTLIRLLYRHSYSDLGPFRAIRTTALRQLGMTDRNYGWTVEMQIRALWRHLRIVEIPIPYGVRRAGTPKISGNLLASFHAGRIILTTVFRLWLSAPSAIPNTPPESPRPVTPPPAPDPPPPRA